MTDISGIGRQSQIGGLQQSGHVETTQGTLGDHTVQLGQPEPRAQSALKTAWMEVGHFFKSLFGIRVSTAKPEVVNSPETAAKSVLHEMTRSKTDDLDIISSIATLIDHLPVPEEQDPDRSQLLQGARAALSSEIGEMSDMQLIRLNSTFNTKPELISTLGQYTLAHAMDHYEELDRGGASQADTMRGSGKMADVGFVSSELYGMVQDELRARGYVPREPGPDVASTADVSYELHKLADKVVTNFGDLHQAITDTRAEIAQEKQEAVLSALEASGLYTREPVRDEGAPQQVQVQVQAPQPQGGFGALKQAALDDPRMPALSTGAMTQRDDLYGFFTDHFEVCISPGFWDHFQAKAANPEIFGATLSRIVIERVQQQGEIRPKDVADLQNILDRCGSGYQLPQGLEGQLDDTRLGAMGSAFFESFVGNGAPLPMNMYGDMGRLNTTYNDPTSTGAQKLGVAMEGYEFAWTVLVQLPSDSVSGPVGNA